MNFAKLLILPRRLMVPIIFDNDGLWSGCSDDAAFFARNKKRTLRFRNAFPGEWSEFGKEYQSVLVIRFPSWGFRLRIGLPIKRFYDSHFEASSDYHASEQLAEQCEEVESAKPSLSSGGTE
jgi:hypothetical protein